MKKLLRLTFLLFSVTFIFAQSNTHDEKFWSNQNKLTIADYQVTTDNLENPVKSQINLSWQLMGFSVLNKNFNQNVTNKFIRSASLINPDLPNVKELLYYQQINFDMAEVYARKMRKDLFINKSKLWKGFDFATKILNDNLHEFYKVQLLMDRDTNGGLDAEKVMKWKTLSDTELNNSNQFDFNNTEKIKIDKISTASEQKVWL